MSTASKIINIEDVSLKTMQVEIRALVVSGKQMTLSVFRQLPKMDYFRIECLTHESIKIFHPLGAVAWGVVNYKFGGSSDDKHLVWQLENTLYRQYLPSIRHIFDAYHGYLNDKQGEFLSNLSKLPQLFIAI